MNPLTYAVTTSRKATSELHTAALEWARRLDARFVPRADRSLTKICEEEGVEGLLTVTPKRVVLQLPAEGIEYFFHPNMARTRIHNLREGGGDPMVTAMALSPGDEALDCTLGRGSDAIVASWVVREEGRVVGIEVVPLVAELTIAGLKAYEIEGPGLMDAMRRIEARRGDYEQVLPSLPDGAFDVVSQAMAQLRRIGEHRELREEVVREAARVARRCVVIKQRREGPLRELPGIERIEGGAGSRIEYVVLGPRTSD